MQGSLGAVVALCLISAVNMASLPPTVVDAHLSPLISEAIATYNRESDSEYAFALLTDKDGHGMEFNRTNEAKFPIKETVCNKSDYDDQSRCDYKLRGVEKSCSASMEGSRLIVICTSVNGDETSKQRIVVDKQELKVPDGETADLNQHMLYRERTIVIKESIQRMSPGGEEEEVQEVGVKEEEVQEEGVKEEEVQEEEVQEEEVKKASVVDDDYDYYLPDIVIEYNDDYETDDTSSKPQNPQQQMPYSEIQGRYLCLECIFFDLPRM
ncbi:uncharacterized protein [Hyperolius riggenbachi]|uniref:uncharacterized protein isoform X2 n=1 Tax=Hyperolius riggenbachi TaxID=752182 RepID=UPI0035A31959